MLLVGFYRPILTLSMRAFGPRNSAYAFLDHDRHTDIYIYIYISREISIEHPSVGLASLAQLNTNTIHSIFLLSSSASRANLSSVGATIFTSLAFLSSSVSMTNLSRLVAASFSSLALSSSVSMANLSCLLVTTFSSLKLLSNSLSSPRFHLLRVGRRCYSVIFCFLTFASYPQHTEAPFALAYSRNE